jgi:hypothetical protein
MSLKFPCTLLLGLLLTALAIITPSSAAPTDDPHPLKLTAEIISQRYCRATDKTFTVIFRTKMRVLNQSNQKLIVENTLRNGAYGIAIAQDAKRLSEGKFLYNPVVEWQIQHDPPEPGYEPGGDFAILAPGKSFQDQRELWATGVGRLHDAEDAPDAIRSGNYILQISFSTWDYDAKPEATQKRWKPFGHLVFDRIVFEPLPFNLPTDPKIGKCN